MDFSKLTPEQLANTPQLPPPPGVTSNFVNPESIAPQYTAGLVIGLVLTAFVVTIRFYGKLRIAKSIGWDDWAALIAAVLTIILGSVTILVFARPGYATHTWDVPLASILNPAYIQRLTAVEFLNSWSVCFAKLSILLFLLNLFPRSARPVTAIFLYIGIGLNIVFYCVFTIILGVVCIPRGSNAVLPESCPNFVQFRFGEAAAGCNTGLDLYVLLVAIPTVLGLQMNMRRKIGVIVVLCSGLIACICSILVLAWRLNEDFSDPAWNGTAPLALATFEAVASTVTACLPTLPIVWRRFAPAFQLSLNRLLSTISRSSPGSSKAGDTQLDGSFHDPYKNGTTHKSSTSGGSHTQYDEHELASFEPSAGKFRVATARDAYEAHNSV